MSVSFDTGTSSFEIISLSLVVIIMPLQRSTSKETTKSSISEVFESTLATMPILFESQLFIEKDSDITWHRVNNAFIATNSKPYLEDRQVYIKIHN